MPVKHRGKRLAKRSIKCGKRKVKNGCRKRKVKICGGKRKVVHGGGRSKELKWPWD